MGSCEDFVKEYLQYSDYQNVKSFNFTDKILFQCILGFTFGIIYGPIYNSLGFFLISVIIFEFIVLSSTMYYPPEVRTQDRILINLFGILGFIISRYIFKKETGFEEPLVLFRD